jgi:hypothetical protein
MSMMDDAERCSKVRRNGELIAGPNCTFDEAVEACRRLHPRISIFYIHRIAHMVVEIRFVPTPWVNVVERLI